MRITYFLKGQSKLNPDYGVIQVSILLNNSKRLKISTGERIKIKNWSNGYPIRDSRVIAKIDSLTELLKKIKPFGNSGVTVEQIKQTVKDWRNDEIIVNESSAIINRYLQYKKRTVQPITFSKIEKDIIDFKQFLKHKDLTEINQQFLDRYKSYLTKKNLQVSTLNNFIKNVKAFLKWTYLNDYTGDVAKKIVKFKESEKEIIALSYKEIGQLIDATTSEDEDIELPERLIKVRDLFVFACYSGLRYSDLMNVDESKVLDKILTIRQQKTDNIVRIPLTQENIDILNLYNGKLPQVSHQKANKYLKELFTRLKLNRNVLVSTKYHNEKTQDTYKPLNEIISFHIARKTFISVALSLNVPTKVVQKISGHKKDATFNKYIKFTDEFFLQEIEKISDFDILLRDLVKQRQEEKRKKGEKD